MQPGSRIGRYEVREKIGAGGLGEVFLAFDTGLEREAAVKVLNATVASSDQHVRRFVQEAKAASALNHPNILTIYEIGSLDNSHFIAAELIKGETLRERLRKGPLALVDALDVAAQLADGLNAAHKAGILHRDVKPENTMIRQDGLVKVLDFGLAKLFDASNGKNLDLEASTQDLISTDPGVVRGTVHYMSPEQARGKPVDARTDVWSLGVVLYEMLTGERPFIGETVSDVLAAILTKVPADLVTYDGNLPWEVQRIVSRSLRKDSEERYQGMQDLALDLKELKRELANSSELRPVSRPMTVAGSRPQGRRSRPWLIGISSLVLISMLIFAGGWMAGWRGGVIGVPDPTTPRVAEVIGWHSSPGEGDAFGSFSPDGKMIAFPSTKSGKVDLWVKQALSGEAIQITSDKFANSCPVWSPNGDEIAFLSLRGGRLGAWRLPSLGGTATLVGAVPAGALIKRWGKSGVLYYEFNQSVFKLDINTGLSAHLTELEKGVVPNSVSISSDEKQIAYVTLKEKRWSLQTVGIGAGAVEQTAFSSMSEIRNSVWHSDSKKILFSSNPDRVFQIYSIEIGGGQPSQITFANSNCLVLDVSTDGTAVLYGTSEEGSDLWTADVDGSVTESALSTEVGSALWPDVSTDGRMVTYQYIKNLSQGNELADGAIMTRQIQGAAPPLQIAPNGFLPIWSPDNKQIAYLRYVSDKGGIWTTDASGGEQKLIVDQGFDVPDYTQLPYNHFEQSYFAWSPDSAFLVFPGHRGKIDNLYLVLRDGKEEKQLTDNQNENAIFACPLWSPDGRRIAFSVTEQAEEVVGYSIRMVDIAGSSGIVYKTPAPLRLVGWLSNEELLFSSVSGQAPDGLPADVRLSRLTISTGKLSPLTILRAAYLFNIRLSPDRSSVAFAARNDNKDNLWTFTVNAGRPRKLTNNLDPKIFFSSLAWSTDGRTIVYGRQVRQSVLSMIVNFK